MNLLKNGSTAKKLLLFMADSTTPTAGKTGLAPAVRVSKNGAAFAAGGGTVAELEGGFYAYTFAAGDVDTDGPLGIRATATGAVDFVGVRQVVPFDPYDAAGLGLSRLDAAVSSRSTYAGTDTAGTTTLLGRLTSGRATGLDNLDATVSSRSTYAGADTAGTTTLLGRLSSTRAGLLDNLDVAVSTRSSYAGADTPGITTLLSRLTAGRAASLDNLDAAVSSRLAGAAYVPPDNATILATGTIVNHLATAMEPDGPDWRFTANALEQAPTGGGGGGTTDWTDPERQQIRRALGVTGTAANTSGSGLLDTIYNRVAAAGATITVAGVVPSAGGAIPIVRGDDYRARDGRALTWSSATGLDLGTATVTLVVHQDAGPTSGTLTTSAVAVAGVAGAWGLSADLTAAQTVLLSQYRHALEVVAVLANGDALTLLQGTLKATD